MRTLQVGDILYLTSVLSSCTWYYRYEVESTTKTHAILKNKTKVQVNGNSLGYKVANDNTYYELETPKLKEAYEMQIAIKNLLGAVDKLKNSLGEICKHVSINEIYILTQPLKDFMSKNS
jgi:hypothetical protein